MRKVAVLGMGRFGRRLATELSAAGVEVLAVDKNYRLVEDIRDEVTIAVQLDTTDEDAMRAQNVSVLDVCVIAIGEGFEASLLTTLICKKLGVPTVIARAQNQMQADILQRVGADFIIQPENEAALRWSRKLSNPHLEDFIELDDDHGIIQLHAPARFRDHTLSELGLRSRYGVNLVAIKRLVDAGETEDSGKRSIRIPRAEDKILTGDILVLVGTQKALAELPQE